MPRVFTDPDDPWNCCYVLVEDRRGGRWSVLVDPNFRYGDAQEELREWSRGTRVVCLLVLPRELFSHALAWADGEMVWQISFEGWLDDRPAASGRLPFDPEALGCHLGPADDPRTWFRVPIAAVELLTGWWPSTGPVRAGA